jgi:predicted dehydrogenase
VINRTLKIGVVGAGMVSQIAHLPAIAALRDVSLTALADLDLVLANQVARRFGCMQVYDSHTALLRESGVDAVVVVTHRHITASVVRDSLLMGKHVLSEKPMAMTLSVARELVALAEQQRLVYAVGFMKRYDPGVAQARATLMKLRASKRLGELVLIRGKNFCSEYVGYCNDYVRGASKQVIPSMAFTAPHWLDSNLGDRYDWFANVGLHSINLLRYLLGCDLRLGHAALHYKHAVSLLFEAAGIPVSMDMGKAATGRWEESFEFFFERGRLSIQLTSLKQRDRCASVRLDENTVGAQTVYLRNDNLGPWSFVGQMQAFVDTILGSTEALLSTGENSLRDVELLDDIFLEGQKTQHEQ